MGGFVSAEQALRWVREQMAADMEFGVHGPGDPEGWVWGSLDKGVLKRERDGGVSALAPLALCKKPKGRRSVVYTEQCEHRYQDTQMR